MKKFMITGLLLAWGMFSFAQIIYNNGAHIVSTSGSYWVIDNDDFTLTSSSANNLVQFFNLKIESNASLTIPSSNCMTVDGALINTGTLTLNSGASLITNGTITNNGNINIEKTIPEDSKWHLTSVPNNNTTANKFYGDYLVPWNETAGEWQNITDETTPLLPAKGYNVKVTASDGNYTFSGTPNTGDQNIAISYTNNPTLFKGANLVGNPYPSSIDWNTVTGYGACYIWNGTAYQAYIDTDYDLGSQYIAPMQGFFIVPDAAAVTAASESFNLSNDNRVHDEANTFYKSTTTLNAIVLAASNGSYLDELYLIFDEGASEEFELPRDAYKFMSNTEGLSQIYSIDKETKFSIDVRPETGMIPLGFKNDKDGIYSIGLKEMDGLNGAFIEDTKNNYFHNLENSDYQFNWINTDSENRFKFHTSITAAEDIKVHLAQIYAFNKVLYIQSIDPLKNASIHIIDLTGREVFQKALQASQNETIELELANGVYTVLLTSKEGSQSKKVILY